MSNNRILWLNPLTGGYTISGEPDGTGDLGVVPDPPVMAAVDQHEGIVALSLTATVTISRLWFGGRASYLRQRQSPVRAPSRIRGTDLRQKQTPSIR